MMHIFCFTKRQLDCGQTKYVYSFVDRSQRECVSTKVREMQKMHSQMTLLST